MTLHHPLLDSIRLHSEHRLAAFIERHPQIVAVLCGHAHSPAVSSFAGRPLMVAPGVVTTLVLPWEAGEVLGWDSDRILDFDMPPALAFHELDESGRLTTHFRLVP